jgi:hypothetical protein
MSRKQLENFSEQERRHKLGAPIAGFAASPESDEEKANRKREKVIENLARRNSEHSMKRETQRTKEAQAKLEESSGGR